MKIQYCSDLHLEFPENRKLLEKNPLHLAGDVLLLAGDIITFPDLEKAGGFFDWVCDRYSAVYWVPGNHEYYGASIDEKADPLFEKIRSNLFLVNNQAIDIGGCRLVATTLWGKISPLHEWDIQKSLSDFAVIRYQDRKFAPADFSLLHQKSLEFLKSTLSFPSEQPTIVLTHHVPTLVNYPPVYKNSVLTEAFAVELFDLITDTAPDYWIYGHHHINVPEFKVGQTKMLTNQLGYVRHFEHKSFRRDAWIEL